MKVPHSVGSGTASKSCPQIGLWEVMQGWPDQSAWCTQLEAPVSLSMARRGRCGKLSRNCFQEAQMSTATTSSRSPYVQWLIESRPPRLTWSRSSLQPAPAGLDRSGSQRRLGRHAGRPRCPGEPGQGRLGRQTTTWTTRCPGVEYHTCIGPDSGAAGPASDCSSHSFPKVAQSSPRAMSARARSGRE